MRNLVWVILLVVGLSGNGWAQEPVQPTQLKPIEVEIKGNATVPWKLGLKLALLINLEMSGTAQVVATEIGFEVIPQLEISASVFNGKLKLPLDFVDTVLLPLKEQTKALVTALLVDLRNLPLLDEKGERLNPEKSIIAIRDHGKALPLQSGDKLPFVYDEGKAVLTVTCEFDPITMAVRSKVHTARREARRKAKAKAVKQVTQVEDVKKKSSPLGGLLEGFDDLLPFMVLRVEISGQPVPPSSP